MHPGRQTPEGKPARRSQNRDVPPTEERAPDSRRPRGSRSPLNTQRTPHPHTGPRRSPRRSFPAPCIPPNRAAGSVLGLPSADPGRGFWTSLAPCITSVQGMSLSPGIEAEFLWISVKRRARGLITALIQSLLPTESWTSEGEFSG